MTPPREPVPYPPTREIMFRPARRLPPVPPPAARSALIASELEADYPDPRSRNPLYVYGPAIFVVGALVFVAAMIALVVAWAT